MATLLDVGLLTYLLPFFIFLFVLAVVFGILSKTKFISDNNTINLVIAICIAAVSIFAGTITGAISSIIPWIVFVALILVLIFVIFMFFGLKESEVWDTIGGKTLIFIIFLLIIFIGVTKTFEKDVSPYTAPNGTVITPSGGVQGGNVQGEVVRTITHPRLLAAIFILVTSGFAIRLIIDKV